MDLESIATKEVFRTGEVGKLCRVAPRTVSKWFDSGKLKGYRIPGGQDRRIPRAELIRFLKEHGMPLYELAKHDPSGTVRRPADWEKAVSVQG